MDALKMKKEMLFKKYDLCTKDKTKLNKVN